MVIEGDELTLFPAALLDKCCKELLSDDVVEALYAFGYSHYQIGKYKEAGTIFRLLTGLRIRDHRFWKGLGSAHQMQKQYQDAVDAYSMAALMDEKQSDPHPHYHAAECLHTMGMVGRGIQALDAARIVAKRNDRKYLNLLQKIAFMRGVWGGKKRRKKS